MSVIGGQNIIQQGAIIYIDPTNPKSYISGSNFIQNLVYSSNPTSSLPSQVGVSDTFFKQFLLSGSTINLGNIGNITNGFTVEAVLQPSLITSSAFFPDYTVFSYMDSFYSSSLTYKLQCFPSSSIVMMIIGSGSLNIALTASYNPSRSNVITSVVRPERVVFYINGSPLNSTAITGSINYSGSNRMFIGGENNQTTFDYNRYTGSLNSLIVYNTALSDNQVLENFNTIYKSRYNIPQGPTSSLDIDYLRLINYATNRGYTTPTSDQQIYQSQLIQSLKTYGIWDKLDLFYDFASNGDKDFQTLNWKSPLNYRLTPTTSSIMVGRGFKSNGVSSYLDTNFNLLNNGVNYTQNNASRYFYKSTADGYIFDGTTTGDNNFSQGSSINGINSSTGISTPGNITTQPGMKSIHRTSNTSVTIFENTTSNTVSNTSISTPNTNQLILRARSFYSDAQVSMYALGASLVNENSNFVTSYSTYLNNISSSAVSDSDYLNVLVFATSASNDYDLPSPFQQLQHQQLIQNLKTSSIWNKLDVFYNFMSDGSSGFNLINWKNTGSYFITSSGNIVHEKNRGFKGDSIAAYLDTNYDPSTSGVNYTLENASRYVFVTGVGTTSSLLDGVLTDNTNLLYASGSDISKINSLVNLSQSFEMSGSYLMKSIHRSGSINATLFNGTSSFTTSQSVDVALFGGNQYILRSGTTYGDSTIGMYAMGSSLINENTSFVNSYVTYSNTVFDPDYTKILNYARASGFKIPLLSQQIKQSRLITDFKNFNIWNKLELLYVPNINADYNFAAINWISPGTYTLAPKGATTYNTSSGFINTRTIISYLNTNYTTITNFTSASQNNMHFSLHSTFNAGALNYNVISSNSTRIGVRPNGNRVENQIQGNGSAPVGISGNTGQPLQGYYTLFDRSVSTGFDCFRAPSIGNGSYTQPSSNTPSAISLYSRTQAIPFNSLISFNVFTLGSSISASAAGHYEAINRYVGY